MKKKGVPSSLCVGEIVTNKLQKQNVLKIKILFNGYIFEKNDETFQIYRKFSDLNILFFNLILCYPI